MQIAIVSDIHDNLWTLEAAIQFLDGRASALLCCGDLCSPFVIDQLGRFPQDIHVVFGNNDADLFRITKNAAKLPQMHLHGEFFEGTFESRRFAMNHYDSIARPLAASEQYDVVCFGHNHELETARLGHTLLINPGPIMGAKFTGGQWQDTASTFVIYDTASDVVEIYAVDPNSHSVGPLNSF